MMHLINTDLWRMQKVANATVYYRGRIVDFEGLSCICNGPFDKQKFKCFLRKQKSNFSIIMLLNDMMVAAVDRVASIPLFYDKICIYDKVEGASVEKTISCRSTEYLCAGFISNRNTLLEGMYRLQAGEFIIDNAGMSVESYYCYRDNLYANYAVNHSIEALDVLFDSVIKRSLEHANGARILLPLSGGLDSRIILAKLVQHRYDNLYVFTYGVKNNHEAIMAKKVAKALGVPWNYFPLNKVNVTKQHFKDFYNGYLSYNHLVSSVPSVLELMAFYYLKQCDLLKPNDIVINGQTGDFITGGHIRLDLIGEITQKNILRYILKKHYALWPKLLTDSYVQMCNKNLEMELDSYQEKTGSHDLLAFYEYWEWKERQSKLVVNGQRLYDYLGLNWSLPFWDADMMDFWDACPLTQKLNQKLYTDYLAHYNYKGVFDIMRLPANPWASKFQLIRYLGMAIKLVAGNQLKNNFYKYMDYYSTYHDQYRLSGRDVYKKYWRDIRNPVSLMALNCLQKLGISELLNKELAL